MLRTNTARSTRGAPQSGQGMPTLLEEWHQRSASGSLQHPSCLMDQWLHSLTPGSIAQPWRRLASLTQIMGWARQVWEWKGLYRMKPPSVPLLEPPPPVLLLEPPRASG